MGFPEQLKKARKKIGYTQQEVAEYIGITKSTYCGYETGKRQPDVAKIKMLSKILNTSGDYLLETGFEKDNTTDECLQEIIDCYNGMTDEGKNLLLKQARYHLGEYPKIDEKRESNAV